MANEGTVQQLGPYRLIRKLGEGGMGAVYLADDPSNGRKVALKVLPRSASANVEFVKRFRREAEAAAQLKHPCIVAGYAAGEDKGFHFFAMEYCDGEPLDKLLKREKLVSPARALEILVMIAKGLQHAHAQGIIHRDIKPSNIFLTKDGGVKILDLGLSKNLAEAERSFNTVSGAVLGTPHYISPEQAKGDKTIDGRTDLYSLGATFYHLLTGQTPFDGAMAMEIMYKHVHEEMPNPQDLREDIPEGHVHVLRRLMAKNPEDRYASSDELLVDLKELLLGGTPKTILQDAKKSSIALRRRPTLSARPPTVRRMATPPPKKPKAPLLWGGVAAAVVAVILIPILASGDRAPERTAPLVPPPAPRVPAPAPSSAKTPPPVVPATNPEEDFVRRVASTPVSEQAAVVLGRLKDLNPGFDGLGRQETENGKIVLLEFHGHWVKNLSPIRALPGLERLQMAGEPEGGGWLSDLGPLRDLKSLKVLSIHGSNVSDLEPLRGLKLVELYAGYSKITSIAPLEGMPLRLLACHATPLTSIAPIKGASLTSFYVGRTKVTDLSPIRDMPIEDLGVDLDLARDRAILKSLKKLVKINNIPIAEFWASAEPSRPADPAGPEELVRTVAAKLKERNPGMKGSPSWKMAEGKAVALTMSSVGVKDLSPLAALADLRELTCRGEWDEATAQFTPGGLDTLESLSGLALNKLDCSLNPVVSLAPLKGMPLENLQIDSTNVSDLSPLAGLPLRVLSIGGTPVRDLRALRSLKLSAIILWKTAVDDLSPLKGMKLENLSVSKTEVRSIEAIRGMPLYYTDLRDTKIADLSPLKETQICDLWCDLVPARDSAMLKSIKSLQTINGRPAKDVLGSGSWRPVFDGKTLDWLDPETKPFWKIENGALVNLNPSGDSPAQSRLEIEDGELRIRFEEQGLTYLTFTVRAGVGKYRLEFRRDRIRGLEGQEHTLLFTCRGAEVKATLDGQPLEWIEASPSNAGRLKFFSNGGRLRVKAIEHRP